MRPPGGVIVARSYKHLRQPSEDQEALRLLGAYNTFRSERKAQGWDPDMIGEHEVKPVHCRDCGAVIPWRLLKGYHD